VFPNRGVTFLRKPVLYLSRAVDAWREARSVDCICNVSLANLFRTNINSSLVNRRYQNQIWLSLLAIYQKIAQPARHDRVSFRQNSGGTVLSRHRS